MAKSIKVIIGGKEYSLRGDNEKLIQHVAGEVNSQLREIGSRHGEESATTQTVLTALNLAERGIRDRAQKEANELYVENELGKMAELINGCIAD